MNFKEAKKNAEEWLSRIDLPDDIEGKQINLLSYIHDPVDSPLFIQKRNLLGREIRKRGGRSIGEPDNWTFEESEFISDFYLSELKNKLLKIQTKTFNESRAYLKERLSKSNKAVRLKMYHISSILVNSDMPYLELFQPIPRAEIDLIDWNETNILKNKLLKELNSKEFIKLLQKVLTQSDYSCNLSSNVLIEDSPISDILEDNNYNPKKSVKIRPKINYVEREIRNTKLGEAGEEWVIKFEKQRLEKLGRIDLAEKIVWASKEIGDGLGYDIESFDKNGNQIFIEVKTTCLGKYAAFYVTEREVKTSLEIGSNYFMYRVYDFDRDSKVYAIKSNIETELDLIASIYRATIKKSDSIAKPCFQ